MPDATVHQKPVFEQVRELETRHKHLVSQFIKDGRKHRIVREIAIDLCGGDRDSFRKLFLLKKQELVDTGQMPKDWSVVEKS